MKIRLVRLSSMVGLTVLAGICLAGIAPAQDNKTEPKGRYVVLPARLRYDVNVPPAALQTWNGSFTYKAKNYSYNMVGTAPSSNTSTTVTAFIIPLKIVITPRRGHRLPTIRHTCSRTGRR